MTTLDQIKADLAAATPGPWVWSEKEDGWGDCGPNLETAERGPVYFDGSQGAKEEVIGSWGHDANGISVGDADARFIANAPANVARLIAALEAVEERLKFLDALEEAQPSGMWSTNASAGGVASVIRKDIKRALGES